MEETAVEVKKYTLEEVAEMTSFSTRTIRNYIGKNILSGEKINGKWYFSEEDFRRFLGEPYVKQGLEIKSDSLIQDYLKQDKEELSVCSVYDYPVENKEKALNLCRRMTEIINGEQLTVSFNFYYDAGKKLGRYIIKGSVEQVKKVAAEIF